MQNEVHQITVTQKKDVNVTGVEGVLGFSESKISLSLKGGGKLYVAGSGLKIVGFSKSCWSNSQIFLLVCNLLTLIYLSILG